jgi:Zn-dependent M28 family amino/carboxypeptidase
MYRKILILLIVTIVVSACKTVSTTTSKNTGLDLKDISIEKISEQQPASETKLILSTLADDKMGGRQPGTPGMEAASAWSMDLLKQAGVKPFFKNGYQDSLIVDGKSSYNIVGVIGNDSNQEYILIGAHLDHIGKTASKTDSVYNGANDDASGVTAVLQIAKFLSKYAVNKNIIVALFTGEESGLVGSGHLAKRLKDGNVNLKYVIAFEMIGKQLTSGKDKVYCTGYKLSDFAQQVNDAVKFNFIEFLPEEESYQLFRRSDNYPFYQQFKVPAHTISTFDFKNYEYYHHLDDEWENLDIEQMNRIINLSTLAIVKLMTENKVITMK